MIGLLRRKPVTLLHLSQQRIAAGSSRGTCERVQVSNDGTGVAEVETELGEFRQG
jgi:hypothetical protein